MKKLGITSLLVAAVLWSAGCSSTKATRTEDLTTWTTLRAALSARFTNGRKALQQANDAKAVAKSAS